MVLIGANRKVHTFHDLKKIKILSDLQKMKILTELDKKMCSCAPRSRPSRRFAATSWAPPASRSVEQTPYGSEL